MSYLLPNNCQKAPCILGQSILSAHKDAEHEKYSIVCFLKRELRYSSPQRHFPQVYTSKSSTFTHKVICFSPRLRRNWNLQFPVKYLLIYISIGFLSLPFESQLPEIMDSYCCYSMPSPYCWESLAHPICLVDTFSLATLNILTLPRQADTCSPGLDTVIGCSYKQCVLENSPWTGHMV